ncbi:MAG: pyridoxal phosphate-dependent aminotransferase [Enterococcaceae bacterium]|jgi:aspartate/methionine/tyrosine aminotransferase|nr:pyridoxal phosphate-dependent aminotransferase [Enterococcaceae bacterium]MCI1919537.1 pyridoxal phosphate-dependent aminotransferase [Enterococcaceae bacterium]
MELSERARRLQPSATLAAAAQAKKLKASGLDVISLTVGEPDFITPAHIEDAAIRAIKSGKTSFYTPTAGLLELREAICADLKRRYGLEYSPEEILATDGAKFALYTLFQAILDEEDEVLLPIPSWVSYAEQVRLAAGVPIFVPTNEAKEFKVTVADLENHRSDKTKALILNSPSNPTGMIYSADELRAIGEWAVEHDILIVADDIYNQLVYNGSEAVSIITTSEAIRQQTIVIDGVSKTYSMTGWRLGYAAGRKDIIQAMVRIASQSTSNPAAASQYAAIEAYNGTQENVEKMRQAFEDRLNHAYELLEEVPGFHTVKPRGAFYLFPNVREAMEKTGFSDINDFVAALLREALVATVSGESFGSKDHLRISYATDLTLVEEAIRRIKHFVETHQK